MPDFHLWLPMECFTEFVKGKVKSAHPRQSYPHKPDTLTIFNISVTGQHRQRGSLKPSWNQDA